MWFPKKIVFRIMYSSHGDADQASRSFHPAALTLLCTNDYLPLFGWFALLEGHQLLINRPSLLIPQPSKPSRSGPETSWGQHNSSSPLKPSGDLSTTCPSPNTSALEYPAAEEPPKVSVLRSRWRRLRCQAPQMVCWL